MAAAQAYSGTETVGTTEWSLTTDTAGPDVTTAAGTYQAFVDLSNLAAGDVYELRLYERVISGASQVRVSTAVFVGPVVDPLVMMPAAILLHGWDYTLVKIAGTDRSITWSIRTP